MALTPEQITEFKQKYNLEPTETTEQDRGFLGDIKEDIFKRTQYALEAGERFQKDEQTFPETVLQTGGQIAGGITDILSRGISAITPDIIEKPIQAGVKKVAETEPVQKAIQGYQDWATKNPRAAKDLEAVLNIATLYPAAKTIQATGKGVAKTAKLVATLPKKGVSVIKPLSKELMPTSESIMQRVARIPKSKQAEFQKLAGESVGEYLTKRGIYGNIDKISQQLSDRFYKSVKNADDLFIKLPGEYKAAPIKTALEQLYKREIKVSAPGALSRDLPRVRELVNKYNKIGLTMPEINEVKRLFEKNVKLEFKKSLSIAPQTVAKATNIDNSLRNWQFNQAIKLGAKNLPQINKETQLAKQLLDDIGKEYFGQAGNNAITLSDWIVLSGGDPTAISAFLVKKGFSSKTLQSAIAKYISKGIKIEEIKPIIGQPKKGIEEFLAK